MFRYLEIAQDVEEISYAHSAQLKGVRTITKLMENMTGRIGLLKRAKGYQDKIKAGYAFWNVIVERYGLELDVLLGSLPNIPKEGPLIVILNHSYGILDGLMLGRISDETRPDFR